MHKNISLLGVYHHQPIDAAEEQLETAYQKVYIPFLQGLEEHPKIKLALHYNGVLYDWFSEKHPEIYDRLRKLIRRRQIEILTSGYYDPILPIIPDEDKIGQIEMQSAFIRETFGTSTSGLLLTQNAWEPSLPKPLAKAGIEYVVFSDSQHDHKKAGYYVTEEEGMVIKLFTNARVVNINSIGEDFFARSGQHKCVLFSDHIEEHPPLGQVYLPGHPRDYLVANLLHKKMLQVSGRQRALDLKAAQRWLYKGEYGRAYSGDFARGAAYSNLIRAEIEIEKASRGGKPFVELTVTDFDKDGMDEVVLVNDLLNLYFSPARGGSLFEIDYKPKAQNIAKQNAFAMKDRFFDPEGKECGDFTDAVYTFMPRRKSGEVGLLLSREGKVDDLPVKVEKQISLLPKQSLFTFEYMITNYGKEKDEFCFGIDFPLALPWENTAGKGGTRRLKMVDGKNGFEVSLEFSEPAHLYEVPAWKFNLGPGESWDLKLTFRIE